jgi:hypothetical protein
MIRPSAIATSPANATTQSEKPVKGSVPPPIAPVAPSTPDPDSTPPCFGCAAGFVDVVETGDALWDVGAVAGVLPLTFGPCAGSPGLPGSGVGFGRGVGGDEG